jgi:hypothetical protein
MHDQLGTGPLRVGVVVRSQNNIEIARGRPGMECVRLIRCGKTVAEIPYTARMSAVDQSRESYWKPNCHIGVCGSDLDRQWADQSPRVILVTADGGWIGPGFSINICAGYKRGAAGRPTRGRRAQVRSAGQLRVLGNVTCAD